MAVFKSLKSILRNPNSRSLIRLPASATPFSSPSPSLFPPPSSISASCPSSFLFSSSSYSIPFTFPLRFTSSHTRFFSPLSQWFLFSGPLFLSSPAWKLLQSATPLYLHGEVGVLRDPESLHLFPIRLNFGSGGPLRGLDSEISGKESSEGVSRFRIQENYLNFPNLISISRMVSGPVLGWMIVNELYLASFVGLALSGITDWLDGFVARKMGINSVVGSYLDPLADKVLIGCVALAMVKKDLLHPALVGLVVIRDVGLVGGAVYKRASTLGWEWKSWSDFINLDATHPEKVEPLFLSKLNTVFQLVLVAAALLQPEFGTEQTQSYLTYLSWLVASTTIASSAAYGAQHLWNNSISTGERWRSISRSKSC